MGKRMIGWSMLLIPLCWVAACESPHPALSEAEQAGDTADDQMTSDDEADTEDFHLKRDELCLEEVSLDVEPQPTPALIVFDRSKFYFVAKQSYNFAPSAVAAMTKMLHATAPWLDLAMMVMPGTACDDNDFGLMSTTSGSLIAGFGDENSVEQIDYDLGGWFGIGYCGFADLNSTLEQSKHYLEISENNVPAEILIISTGEFVSDYGQDGATCFCMYPQNPPDNVCVDYPNLCEHNPDRTAELVTDLHSRGHNVHVLIMNTSQYYFVAPDEWAAAGGTTKAIAASNRSEVNEAMWTAGRKLLSCQLEVDFKNIGPEAAAPLQEKVNVFLNDELLYFDDTCASNSGWHWVSPTTIRLCPDTCQAVKTDIATTAIAFDGSYGCDSRVEVQP